jgi:predicted Zn-dependent peptidase
MPGNRKLVKLALTHETPAVAKVERIVVLWRLSNRRRTARPETGRSKYMRIATRTALLCLVSLAAFGQSLADFEKRVTEFTLPNGMHFIVIERHDAPVVSFHSYVNAGSVDDPSGETGIAHMFEHMAFKGTEAIGSKNYPAERAALEHVEQVYDRLDQAKREAASRHETMDPRRIDVLEKELQEAIAKANSFVLPNEYDRIVEANGGVGLNASTSEDSTNYFYSFPSNRLELWFLLESQRFLAPVFREFYKERDVVREERRMRVESSPQGLLLEALLSTAFAAHPYKNMPGGWASDIDNFRLKEAVRFYETYYVPGNITIGIAGDVDPKEARRLADKYFAVIPKGPLPPEIRTVEPEQRGEKRVQVIVEAQPYLAIAYKRPDQNSKDDPALDILAEVLAGGRTGLLYTELVRDKQLALGAFAQSSFPGSKYPNLFLFYVVPNRGRTLDDNEKACYDIIERLKSKKIDDETLNRVKTKLRADLIRKLDSNSGLAEELTAYHVAYGDWRRLFTEVDQYNKITADDVMRVAREYLRPETRTVVYTTPPDNTQRARTGKTEVSQ